MRLVDLLDRGAPEALLFHDLGPLLARRMRERGVDDLPPAIQWEERLATYGMITVRPLLERIREACDGPLVLMKGPELALRYPAEARSFGDVDLLVPDPRLVHGQLQESGFVEVGDPALFHRIHHLRPLKWPTLPLLVELHSRPKWPEGLSDPPVAEIFESAVPSAIRVDGVAAPIPSHHVLLVAAHAWAHEPLHRLRDLLDVHVLTAETSAEEIDEVARRWHARRLWGTTAAAAAAVFAGRRTPLSLQLWARHLDAIRERSVLEAHLQDVVAPFWVLPPGSAGRLAGIALRRDALRSPEESWGAKLTRSIRAARNAVSPVSEHDRALGDAARRGQHRNDPEVL